MSCSTSPPCAKPILGAEASAAWVSSADGTKIVYFSQGQGPALVLVPGNGRMAYHYAALAQALADRFAVHTVERRGRGRSGPQGEAYAIERETEDIAAVLQATGAQRLFGHSYGGLAALHLALTGYPLHRLAVYEPGVSIQGSFPRDWVPAFEASYAQGRLIHALGLFLRGTRLNPICSLPLPLVKILARLLLSGANGPENAALMATYSAEIREVIRLDSDGERYRAIAVPTLLLGGSHSPDWLRVVLPVLQRLIPASRQIVLPGLDHNAPDLNAPAAVAAQLLRFMA